MSPPDPRVRRLVAEDAEACYALRLEALEDAPSAFLASPEEERARGLEGMRAGLSKPAEEAVVLGAFLEDRLVGMTGVGVMNRPKTAHRAFVWGVYLRPGARGRGLGAAMLDAALEAARGFPGVVAVYLTVEAENLPARRLYEGRGFTAWGREPRALRVAGVEYDDLHLWREL